MGRRWGDREAKGGDGVERMINSKGERGEATRRQHTENERYLKGNIENVLNDKEWENKVKA